MAQTNSRQARQRRHFAKLRVEHRARLRELGVKLPSGLAPTTAAPASSAEPAKS